MFELTVFANLLFVTTAINLLVFVVSWQRRASAAGSYFALGMLAITIWTLAAGLDYASVPLAQKILFAKIEYAASYAALTLMAFFALEFAGYGAWLSSNRRRVVLVLPPILVVLLAWTNELHGWLWSSFSKGEVGRNTVVFEHGPAYALALIVGYALAGGFCLALLQAARHGSELTRRQGRYLFVASLVPILGNLTYLVQAEELRGIDWSSITFSAAGILFLAALYGTRLLDLTPIARDQLMKGLADGMVVLDTSGRIVEINPPALTMLSLPGEEVIGESLWEIVSEARPVLEGDLTLEVRAEIALDGE